MTLRRPLVSFGGKRYQIPSGDYLLPSCVLAREKLLAARTYYVRTDGSDSNTGLANTSGGAFLTIQKAVDMAAGLDLGIYDVTIFVGTGTWTAATTLKTLVGAGKVLIRGINADMTSTVVSTTGSPCISCGDGFSGVYHLQYMRLTKTGAGATISGAGGGGVVLWDNLDFGPNTSDTHVVAGGGQFMKAMGPYTISGGALAHLGAYDSGHLRVQGLTLTITGTPAFGVAFAIVGRGSSALVNGCTFSGAATGSRYSVTLNGILLAFGGATYLPGNAAGTTATGGQYA